MTERQLSLLERQTRDDPSLSPDERLQRFCRRNPWFEREVVRLARAAKAKGLARWSMKAAFEYIRWSRFFDSDEVWKLNNNWTAPMARRVMERYEDLDGFFETRERRSA